MKQILLFASAIALMTSCAKTELGTNEPAPVEGKGLVFQASVSENTDTKAELFPNGKVFGTSWYADKDKLGIAYKGDVVANVVANELTTGVNGWFGFKNATTPTEANSFVFKATASSNNGIFVAANDGYVLDFKTVAATAVAKAELRAFWPIPATENDLVATSGKVDMPTIAAQTQTSVEGNGIVEKSFMVSESTLENSDPNPNDVSISRKTVKLALNRVTPIVYFNTKIADVEEYDNFGRLTSVKLEAKGIDATATDASNLDYGTATYNVLATDLYADANLTVSTPTKAIKTTLDNAITEWSNDANVYMVINNVDRSQMKTDGKKEKMVASYSFAKMFVTQTIETNNDWKVKFIEVNGKKEVSNNWYPFPTLNIDALPYIAYESATTGQYVLQLNTPFTGDLKDIFDASGNLKNFMQVDGTTALNKSDISQFVSKVDLSDANIKAISDINVGMTSISLLVDKSIPAEAFKNITASTFKTLNLPEVTVITNANALPNSAALENVYMGSYDFLNDDIRGALLKKGSLVTADISAVPDIDALFPKNGISFNGFTKLEEIKVQDGVTIGTFGFFNCTELRIVDFNTATGAVNIQGNSAFKDCDALQVIAISNMAIEDATFQGCTTLRDITTDGTAPIQPTTIGISAFEGCSGIADMDLSRATVIGKAAFKDCVTLMGNDNVQANRTVLYVDAITELADNTFDGCTLLDLVSFKNVTKVGKDIFANGVVLEEIEFMKPITSTTITAGSFGTITDTKLFVNKLQTGISTNTLTLNSIGFTFTNGGINKKY